jgi:hypothetical protein
VDEDIAEAVSVILDIEVSVIVVSDVLVLLSPHELNTATEEAMSRKEPKVFFIKVFINGGIN